MIYTEVTPQVQKRKKKSHKEDKCKSKYASGEQLIESRLEKELTRPIKEIST